MDFSQNSTSAKKAWFWFDDEWVALGADIESSHEASIVTGINQCHLKGDVIVDGVALSTGQTTLRNPGWVLHDSVAYIFPRNYNVEMKADLQLGNIRRIYGLGEDSTYAPAVFSLWFDHGIQPKNEHYEYIVVPGKSSKDIQQYTQNSPIRILENTSKIQAVHHDKLKLTGVAFHHAGQYSFDDKIIKVDQPSLVLFDEINGTVSLSDPTTKLDKFDIEITQGADKIWAETVDLPSAEFAGKSVIIQL